METGLGQMSREAGGRGGVIVNISSTCGVTCHGDMFATPVTIITTIIHYYYYYCYYCQAYTASKHAVTALTRTFGVSVQLETV